MQIDLYQSYYINKRKQKKLVSIPLFEINDDVVVRQEISDGISVVEDAWYEIHLTGVKDSVNNIFLYLNDDLIECKIKVCNGKNKDIVFSIDNKIETQLFILQYDIVRLGVKIDKELYVTQYMLCLNSNEADHDNVTNMIKALLEFDDPIIMRWIFEKENRNKSSYMKGEMIKNSYKSVESFYQLLNKILVAYRKNLSMFRNQAVSKFTHIKTNVPYQNVQKFGRDEHTWLMKNMHVLQEVNSEGIVQYGMKKYVPEYIKCDLSKKTTDTYENRMVIAFLYHVIKKAETILNVFCKNIEIEKEKFGRLKKCETDKNKAPILMIKTFQFNNADTNKEKLLKVIKMLKKLYINYLSLMPCKKIELNVLPQKTKVFQEIHHYREIYNLFVIWFEYGELSLDKEEMLFKIKTIDKIYEYFCLLRLLNMIKQHGFEMIEDENSSRFYQYDNLKYGNAKNTDVANTYRFSDGMTRLTLYYEPAIYAADEKTANNISLYRLDGNSYYTPDFLIKCENNGRERYAILDSKFSRRSTLNKNNVLEHLLFKYCISLDSKKGFYPAVNFMWLLQGRQDNAKSNYFCDSKLCVKYHPTVSYGIYILNKLEDGMDEIWDEISRVSIK